jgi:hypothetical protein
MCSEPMPCNLYRHKAYRVQNWIEELKQKVLRTFAYLTRVSCSGVEPARWQAARDDFRNWSLKAVQQTKV